MDVVTDTANTVVRQSTQALQVAAGELAKQATAVAQLANVKDPIAWLTGEEDGFPNLEDGPPDEPPPPLAPVPLAALRPWGSGWAGLAESASSWDCPERAASQQPPPFDADSELNGKVFLWEGVQMDSVRKHIGVIPQDTILFNDSLFYNIAYGDLTASKEKVMEAAKAAQITAAVEKMPEGWNTRVGERGLKLSGGEKQRVAIARAMLKNPPILFCDEATSSLDSQTEEDVVHNLNKLAVNRTTVVIAHRLSTVTDADKIFVIGSGNILEEGNHASLLRKKGHYHKLWTQQTKNNNKE